MSPAPRSAGEGASRAGRRSPRRWGARRRPAPGVERAQRPPAALRADAARHRHRRLHRGGDDVAAQRPPGLDRQEHGRPRRRRVQIQRTPSFSFGPPSPEIQRRKNITLSQVMALREALVFRQAGGRRGLGGRQRGPRREQHRLRRADRRRHPEFFTSNNLPIGTGRGYTEAEAMGASRVIVLGATVADVLFPGANPIGQRVRLGRLTLEVIGTLERQGGSPFGDNPDNLVSVPIALFLEALRDGPLAQHHGDGALARRHVPPPGSGHRRLPQRARPRRQRRERLRHVLQRLGAIDLRRGSPAR